MANKLQSCFPMIRSREEVLTIICSSKKLKNIFYGWEERYQDEFLDFCSGARGVKMLYDSFAKELLNPETVPERLNELLSLLLQTEVEIIQVLPNDNSRIADESSLLLMDIVVRLKDGSIANVEIQKIGYAFPGQRAACYSADLLLRQYKQVRGTKTKDTFSYRDIKNVYTIVFFEKSTSEFHSYPETYLHRFRQTSDTGLQMELLQKYLFIPLDIFRESIHNKNIQNKLEAWLLFLGSDDPEDVIRLIERYPEFKAMYEQVYEICQNVERVMEVFSKELQELDRNTVRYMIDEMQSEIEKKEEEMSQMSEELSRKDDEINRKDDEINRKDEEINRKDEEINRKDEEINRKDEEINRKNRQIEELQRLIEKYSRQEGRQ